MAVASATALWSGKVSAMGQQVHTLASVYMLAQEPASKLVVAANRPGSHQAQHNLHTTVYLSARQLVYPLASSSQSETVLTFASALPLLSLSQSRSPSPSACLLVTGY
jgi:hypothetical protein